MRGSATPPPSCPAGRDAWWWQLVELGLLRAEEHWLVEMFRPERVMRMVEVLRHRTRYISVLLEAVDDGHNQAAVLRSADAFGVQNVTVVAGQQPFAPNKKVTQGAHKWLTIRQEPSIATAVQHLKAQGYRICATYLGEGAVPIDEMDLSQPTVLVFGNEHRGISEAAANLADGKFFIPMYGFVQSFNISVAAALALHDATRRARQTAGDRYFLTPAERRSVFLQWVMRNLRGELREYAAKHLSAADGGMDAQPVMDAEPVWEDEEDL
ncbi:hypothetical protein GCM10010885_05770 [Alicyclobacillus cellulosilyticus]|uniref:tRNA (guanosine(18)-2'-O)-methyltransferase n=1 Tax=Alicyclobacillus cellulosilyticus TaxID=1003997 RepID=A0A917K321_9BACL|nr:RNA methyltransferase [Alicyclobacillus cellulosilyticus]GGI99127.1 hypothetical protein GCM10010885_05770 [Alicyclobacillus cellulosilyticus]